MQNIYSIPLKSFSAVYRSGKKSRVKYWALGLLLLSLLILFLPWTQNIKASGNITTLSQEQRPQQLNSPIPGKITKWWVNEGDFVKKGDTIIQLSEIKEEYLDPDLINRTRQQVEAKKGAITYYQGKAGTAASQIEALQKAQQYKISQLDNKLQQLADKLEGEKAELAAAGNEFSLAKDQYERQQKMFEQGLVSQTQLQQRNVAFQNAMAKKIMVQNKLSQTQQEFGNLRLEQNGVQQEYTEKINKAAGDRFQSLGQATSSQGEMAKLENQVVNYTIRNEMYFIIAPQDGQIVQSKKSGIGEILKEGEHIAIIVPNRVDYAVEMYVRPVDLPLISVGQKVRFMFDGFPAIVFSGWPKNSYGTFGGRVVAYENSIHPTGLFRVLVAEDSTEKKWPGQLKLGSGAQGIALLKDVPVWYELWRNINGFPPDYYTGVNSADKLTNK
ncbi:MAG: HlyD family efflux transporter periplasmic adaptor subunit [Ferruginibacter sp.]